MYLAQHWRPGSALEFSVLSTENRRTGADKSTAETCGFTIELLLMTTTTTLCNLGLFKGSLVWRQKQVLEVHWDY